jgi:hypothetical protein
LGKTNVSIPQIRPSAASAKRLFDGIERSAVGVEIIEVIGTPKVTHLRYAVRR